MQVENPPKPDTRTNPVTTEHKVEKPGKRHTDV